MRVLSVIHGPAFGGAHNQALRLQEPLRSRDIELTVIVPDDAESVGERLRDGGVEVASMPLSRLRAGRDPRPNLRLAARFRREVRQLATLVAAREADVVQVHGPTNPQGALAAGRAGAAVVWQLLDTRTPPALRRLLMPLVIRRADAVAVWGEALAGEHPGAERLGERLVTIYPPVPTVEFDPDPAARAEARRRLGVAGDEVCVLSVGVLNPQKGHEYLIRALPLLGRSVRPRTRARVLGAPSPGHGSRRHALEAEAARLGLLEAGWLEFVDPEDDVALLIQAADVFVLPSARRSEGMPTAVLEAMAAAKPVVASDVGATRELVTEGRTGFLVEPESPAALAAALQRLVEDAPLRERMGAAGRELALARFDLPALADRHAAIYRQAVEHRARRRP